MLSNPLPKKNKCSFFPEGGVNVRIIYFLKAMLENRLLQGPLPVVDDYRKLSWILSVVGAAPRQKNVGLSEEVGGKVG